MAKIPLRAYNREIEGMVDRGQASLAIAHCRHILKYYPKHIDTYRLLGKAFLETQRYAEAADVLQRVLSTVPDDFISQIGMSIIREDEGNLDAAIWHMEKAFEAQPSNSAVQDELRRLYGRRDGVEPPKMRLTRGALVRMYARGELYQQAIAEIRAALAEDPLRVDLEVILARMYYLSGQTVAAIEVCSRLVNKLPYCFEANRILAEVLPTTSRAEDAKLYQQRVYAMDAYLAYLPPNAVSSAEVADNAVTLDQLEIEAGEEVSQLPEWAQTVGVDWKSEQAEEETLPDWFSTPKPDAEGQQTPPDFSAAAVAGFQAAQLAEAEPVQVEPSADLPLIEAEAEEEIPDWMKEAGWAPAETTDPTAQSGFNIPEGDLEIAEIPDWLQEIAPEDAIKTGEADSVAETQDTNWLESILPEEEQAAAEPGEGEILPEGLSIEDQSPSGLVDQTAIEEPALPEIDPSAELPIFTEPTEQPSTGEETLAFLDEEQPDWLKELGESPAAEESVMPDIEFTGDWIQETPAAAPPEIEETGQVQPEPAAPAQDLPDLNDMDATMAWLEGLAARQGADEETLLTTPEDRQETPPEWVQALSEQIAPPGEVETLAGSPFESEVAGEEALSQTDSPPDQSPQAEVELSTGEAGFAAVEVSSQVESAPVEELPDWLVESLEEDQPAPSSPVDAESIEITPPDVSLETPITQEMKPPTTQPLDEDITFAWLEGLAARQGAEEQTLLVPPEQREQTVPDWIQEASQAESQAELATETSTGKDLPSFVETQADETPAEPVFEAAEETVEDTQPVVVVKTGESSSPEWMVEEKITRQTSDVADAAPSQLEKESVPDWLQTLDKEDEATVPPVPSEWLPEFEPPVEEAPAAVAEPQPSTDGMSSTDLLKAAQAALEAHNVERALQSYNQLINNGDYLEETIHDLRDALYRYPIDITIWQTLGDAYMRSNRLQEALEAYTKAEELLR